MISSYWGEGYWGYGYNSVSAANSLPWNRPDIYIDQSPLFGVENVTTPLLLLHGASDTNVPPGESEQMYTALKLLGKEVEYIRVQGQNHWILDYKKRLAWNDAIVSWFDRWLKDQPQWWNDMYPPLNKEKEGDGKDKR
jgi:dipeptidyl aminopeptidase/acylaminoacyl peptidase